MTVVTMQYGDYVFRPVPKMEVTRQLLRRGDTKEIGRIYEIALNGTLVSTTPCFSCVDALEDALESGVVQDGLLFLLTCDDQVVLSGFPRISQNLLFHDTGDNKVFTSKYSLGFQFDDTDSIDGSNQPFDTCSKAYIESFTEDWQFDFADKAYFQWTLPDATVENNPLYVVKVVHNMTAKGRRHFKGPDVDIPHLSREAWEEAKSYLECYVGLNSNFQLQSGVLNLGVAVTGIFDHIRTISIGEAEGTCSISENWLILDTGNLPGRALEDFTVSTRKEINTALINVSVEGTITGLELRNYHDGTTTNYSVDQTKFANASGYYGVIKNRLYQRAKLAYNDVNTTSLSLNPIPLNSVVGWSPTNGVVSYNYSFDSRRPNCLPNSISEVLHVQDGGLTDRFVQIVIPGRSQDLLQDLNTKTPPTRSVSFEAVFEPPSICPTGITNVAGFMAQSNKDKINAILESFQLQLESTYTQVFVTENTFNWDTQAGRVSASKAWILGNC